MKVIYENTFRIPTHYAREVINGDEDLNDEENKSLKSFLERLPANGSWDFSNEAEMENFNDVDNYSFSDCYIATYTVLGDK